MNTFKQYIATGLVIFGLLGLAYLTGKFAIAFDIIKPKDAGMFVVCFIAAVVAMYFVYRFFSQVEHFNNGMMIGSMIIGTGVFISMFGMSGVFYSVVFGAFCKTLEHYGFYKAIYRGLGNVVGSAVGAVHKPKVNKYSKYL